MRASDEPRKYKLGLDREIDVMEEKENSGIFTKTLEMIRENKRVKDNGSFNSIPFGLPSLDKHVPGIMRGCQYLISANSGVESK